ncbi:TMEM175 family protein [Methanobrevibacter sp.]|uniref:TMEM175 family protein n=1 Tax=Methanobrevibacter sp. TaxID=66852 RepID=UPI0026DEC86D|nr:TMEM175 family protein [Methanobrevibacter sp.]MDO5860249.1 TMEM175 family protein [Methanobrevibacter sp.]
MITIKEELTPEEIEELKNSIHEKIEIIKENAADEETFKKWERFSTILKDKDSKFSDNPKKASRYVKFDKGLSFYQRFLQAFERDVDIDPGRLMGLTDGIFGMVMTLLVFGIALPEMFITNYSDFITFITTLAPTIGVTIVSFILISSFWVYHHEFIKVNNLNIPYLWLNILFLICISFIPFTTSLIGNYSHFFLSEALFGLNIFLTIVSFMLVYHYAYKRNFLDPMPSKDETRRVSHTFYLIMGLTIIVNLLDFHVSGNFIYLFLLVPIISTFRDIGYRMTS